MAHHVPDRHGIVSVSPGATGELFMALRFVCARIPVFPEAFHASPRT